MSFLDIFRKKKPKPVQIVILAYGPRFKNFIYISKEEHNKLLDLLEALETCEAIKFLRSATELGQEDAEDLIDNMLYRWHYG